ncbi:MAG: VWA domain-containing protein [Nitrospinales bacterium]
MLFGHPERLHWLWVCVGVILFLAWRERKKSRLRALFCNIAILPKLLNPMSLKRQKTKAVYLVLSVFFLILALTEPRWGFQWEDLKQEGVDIIVALDVSSSMLAKDIKPNRLERAKRKVKDLIQMLDGDRIGLVAFAGASFVLCPLTLDYAAAEIFLDIIDTDLIPVPGTALDQAIRVSVKAFASEDKNSKALILITDGEDHGGGGLEAARSAKERGVKIFAIGIGQELGTPIPGYDGGFKKDKSGEVVLSKLDESSLQRIALATGGSYVRSVTGNMDLNKIYLENVKQTIEKRQLKTSRRKLWQERFQWFILPALLFLIMEFFVNERRSKPDFRFRR